MAIITLTKENFDHVVASNEIVVVDFWAEWCVPCKSFEKIFTEVADQYSDVLFGRVDIEAEPHLATDFMIRSVPTVMILRQKIMVFCESGLLPKTAFVDLIDQAKALNIEEVRKQLGEHI
jgi:thioredoxin 1